jgi:nucleoside 2-deoxyribosyltransferase
MTANQIFAQDVEGIDWADVVVANMDGPDPDSGTSWECGYAYRKKPVILFRTDFRAGYKLGGDRLQIEEKNGAPYNLMLTEAASKRLIYQASSFCRQIGCHGPKLQPVLVET